MKKFAGPFVVAMALGMTAAAAVAEDGVMFSYRYEVGASNRYRVKFNQEADLGGATMGQIADLEVTVKCVSVDEGIYVMEMTFDKADISRQMFDNMSPDPMAEELVGHGVTYTLTSLGKVDDIKPAGYYEAWEKIQQFVEPVVKGWYVRLPGRTLAVGEEWDGDELVEEGAGGVNVTSKSHFKFKEMKKAKGRECAFVTADVTNVLTGVSQTAMGSYEVDGEGKGQFEFSFDPAKSLMVVFKGKMDVEMKMSPMTGGENTVDSNVSYQIERELL